MFLLLRADDTRLVNIGSNDEPNFITVPDVKIPGSVEWTAHQPKNNVSVITLSRDGASHPLVLWGPFTIGAATLYLGITNSRQIRAWLENQLGASNVWNFKGALRGTPALRTRVRNAYQAGLLTLVLRLADGSLKAHRSGERPAGSTVVGILPPHVIAGQSPLGLFAEDEDPLAMTELADLEV